MPAEAYTLLLRANGTAELLEPGADSQWSSDSDEDFLEQWQGTLFLNESDVPEILNYLTDVGELTNIQADHCVIEEESLAGDDAEDDRDADVGDERE